MRNDIKYIESILSSNGDFKDEQRNLDSFLRRAEKLKSAKNVSNTLTKYYRIDIDLTPIELKMDLLSGLAGIEDDLRYQHIERNNTKNVIYNKYR